jgi:hypothetical protein
MSVIPTTRRWQAGHEFEASPGKVIETLISKQTQTKECGCGSSGRTLTSCV